MTVKEITATPAVNPPGIMHVSDLFKDYKKKKIYKQYWYMVQRQLLGLSGIREKQIEDDLENERYLPMIYTLIHHAHAAKGRDEKINAVLDEYMKDLEEVARVVAIDPDIEKDLFKKFHTMLAGTLEGIKNFQDSGFVIDGMIEDEENDEPVGEAMTPGMVKAYSKMKLKIKCSKCGVGIPSYPGRYPANCPNCGATFKPFRQPAEGGPGSLKGSVKKGNKVSIPKAEARVREANIRAEIKKRERLFEAIKSLDPSKPNIHTALKCYNTVMTRIVIEDERTNCGIMEEMIPGMLLEMAALLAGKDVNTIIRRFQKIFTSGPDKLDEREVSRVEFLKATEGQVWEEEGVVRTYRDKETNKIIGQEIKRQGKAPVYILGEYTEEEEESMWEFASSEKTVAANIAKKGYKFVLIPTKGKDKRNLFAKTMDWAKQLVKQFKHQALEIVPIEKYLKDPQYDEAIEEQGENLAEKAVGKAQIKLITYLSNESGEHELSDIARDPMFRGVHFKQIQSAAEALAKKGMITMNGSKISMKESIEEAGMGSHMGGPSSGKLKKGEGKFSTKKTTTGIKYIYKVRGKTFITTTMDPKVADENRWRTELLIAANAYFLSGKIPRGSTQISFESIDEAGYSYKGKAGKKTLLKKGESIEDKVDSRLEEENWIKKAIQKPGALRKQMGVKKGENIPKGKLKKAAKKGGKLGKRARLAVTLGKLRKEGRETALKMGIQNPNSSGQGEHPDHKKNPYHSALGEMGLTYSHTTPIGRMGGGGFYLHHTYKMGKDFSVGVHQNNRGAWVWEAGKGGSGRKHGGQGEAALKKYLKGVKKRMKEEIEEGVKTASVGLNGVDEVGVRTRGKTKEYWIKTGTGLKNVYPVKKPKDIEKFRYALAQALGSMQRASNFVNQLSESTEEKVSHRLNEDMVEMGPKSREKKQVLTQYVVQDNTFIPAGNPAERTKKLDPGIYKVKRSMHGPVFEVSHIRTDELLRFEDERLTSVLQEADAFWDKKKKFKEMKFTHKRGILLYGDPGTGKSCLLKLAMEEMVQRGDVVFLVDDAHIIVSALKAFKEVEKDRHLLVVLEDVDEMCRYNERSILQLFDGDDQVDNVLFLATTNYIKRLPPRILRDGRFDRKVEVYNPPEAGRLAYFNSKLGLKEDEDEIKKHAKDTQGFSFAQMREFLVGVYCLGQEPKVVIKRIRKGFDDGLDESKYSEQDLDNMLEEAGWTNHPFVLTELRTHGSRSKTTQHKISDRDIQDHGIKNPVILDQGNSAKGTWAWAIVKSGPRYHFLLKHKMDKSAEDEIFRDVGDASKAAAPYRESIETKINARLLETSEVIHNIIMQVRSTIPAFEKYLKLKLKRAYKIFKPFVADGQNAVIIKFTPRKAKGEIFAPQIGWRQEYDRGSDLYNVQAFFVPELTQGSSAQEKTIWSKKLMGIYFDQIEPELIFHSLFKKMSHPVEQVESVNERQKSPKERWHGDETKFKTVKTKLGTFKIGSSDFALVRKELGDMDKLLFTKQRDAVNRLDRDLVAKIWSEDPIVNQIGTIKPDDPDIIKAQEVIARRPRRAFQIWLRRVGKYVPKIGQAIRKVGDDEVVPIWFYMMVAKVSGRDMANILLKKYFSTETEKWRAKVKKESKNESGTGTGSEGVDIPNRCKCPACGVSIPKGSGSCVDMKCPECDVTMTDESVRTAAVDNMDKAASKMAARAKRPGDEQLKKKFKRNMKRVQSKGQK